MSQELMNLVEKTSMKAQPPQFEIGDTVDVHTKILEGEKGIIHLNQGDIWTRGSDELGNDGSGRSFFCRIRNVVMAISLGHKSKKELTLSAYPGVDIEYSERYRGRTLKDFSSCFLCDFVQIELNQFAFFSFFPAVQGLLQHR